MDKTVVGPDGGGLLTLTSSASGCGAVVGGSGSVDPVKVLPLSSGNVVITLVSLLLGTGVVLASKGAVLVLSVKGTVLVLSSSAADQLWLPTQLIRLLFSVFTLKAKAFGWH